MLLEFRVKNFRSFHSQQTLSLLASKDKSLQETNTLNTDLKTASRALCSTLIYGANASGKSNLIKAIQFMRSLVIESAKMQEGMTFNLKPFLLNTESAEQASEFEINFLFDGVRYEYGFSLNTQQIINEYLLVYKAFRPQHWFERHYDATTGKDHYHFGAGLKGKKNVWAELTRENSLFLSKAVELNSEQLRPLFNWFANEIVIMNEITPLNPLHCIESLLHTEDRSLICNYLKKADLGITDISVTTERIPTRKIEHNFDANQTKISTAEGEKYNLHFSHETAQGNAIFGLDDESTGTRKYLALITPILTILNKGQTLFVDELDLSLHPLLIQQLVKLFHRPEINKHGAQLIFSTHNTSLLDVSNLFRRDQIWFTEKNEEQASILYSLSDFSPRKNEALERGYLQGRYGGLPFLRLEG